MDKQYNQEPTLAQVSGTSTPLSSSIAPATQSDTLRLLNLLLVLRNLRTPAAPRRSSGGGPLSLPSPPPPARSIISFLTSLHPPLTHRNPRQTSAAYQVARLYETLLRACIPLNFITFLLIPVTPRRRRRRHSPLSWASQPRNLATSLARLCLTPLCSKPPLRPRPAFAVCLDRLDRRRISWPCGDRVLVGAHTQPPWASLPTSMSNRATTIL